MTVMLPKPIKETKQTVTLSRSDWDALIESLEDVEDLAAVNARRAHEAAAGKASTRRNYLTGEEARGLLDWENPLKIWRTKRGLSQRALATQAGISASYLAEIETGQKPGSAGALRDLARVLQVPMEYLVSSNRVQTAFSQLRDLIEATSPEMDAVLEGNRIIEALKERGVADSDLSELRDRLQQLLGRYAGTPGKANALAAILANGFSHK